MYRPYIPILQQYQYDFGDPSWKWGSSPGLTIAHADGWVPYPLVTCIWQPSNEYYSDLIGPNFTKRTLMTFWQFSERDHLRDLAIMQRAIPGNGTKKLRGTSTIYLHPVSSMTQVMPHNSWLSLIQILAGVPILSLVASHTTEGCGLQD